MKSLSKFLKFGDLQIIFILILILIPINFFLFLSRGEGAEFYGSTQYIQFVTLFPESLGDVRLEPLYIAITHFIWKLTGISLPVIFAASRYIIWVGQLVFIYLIFKLLTNQKILAILGVLIFNFSFTQFAIANNLFRNHAANLLIFIIIYLTLRFLNSPKTNLKKYTLGVGVLLGLVSYTHIFTASFIFSTFFLFFIFILLVRFAKRKLYLSFRPKIPQFLLGTIFVSFIVSVPFIVRTIPFYKFLAENFLAGRGPWQLHVASTPTSQGLANVQDFDFNLFSQIINLSFTIFRFIFEFKQISLPLLFLALTFISVVFVITKVRNPANLFILVFWLVTYFGAKLEFFGVSVVSTRFISIVFYPSIFLLALLASLTFERLRSFSAKIGLMVIIFSVFLAHNLPNILETTVMVNSDQFRKRDELTAQVVKEAGINIEPGTVVFSLNTGLPNLRNDLILGYPVEFFSSKDPETALKFAAPYAIKYFLFDSNIGAVRSSATTGEWIYLDFEKFKNEKYFEKLASAENSFAHIFLYRIKKSDESVIDKKPDVVERFNFKGKVDTKKIDEILATKKINQWFILINLSEGAKTVSERINSDGEMFVLNYPAEKFYQVKARKLSNQLKLNLPEIKSRSKSSRVKLGIFLPGAVVHFPNPQTKIEFSYLAEFSYDNYFIESSIDASGLGGFNLHFLDREQYRLAVRIIVTAFGSLVFCLLVLSSFYREKKLVFWKLKQQDRALSWFLSIFIILAIADSAFFTTFFTQLYKSFIP